MHRTSGIKFRKDELGVVAILAAILILPLLGFCAMAVDIGRQVAMGTRLQLALDATAVSVAKAVRMDNLNDGQAQQLANDLFALHGEKNIAYGASFSAISVGVNRSSGVVEVRLDSGVQASMASTFSRVLGMTSLAAVRNAVASYGLREIELGLMLDVSGSMSDGNKINDLKQSVRELINTLVRPDGHGNPARIGLAPYSTSVNAGAYASAVTGGASTSCVTERGGSSAFTDASPFGAQLGAATGNCPPNVVVPLSADKNLLLQHVNDLEPTNMTAGHLGAAWAWYMVSPNWNSVWPASAARAYGSGDVIKAVVLMTDGIFNMSYDAGNGDLVQQALRLCEEMKLKDILVYAVALDAPVAAAATLATCATSPQHFFTAANGNDLRDAFRRIGEALVEIRLTR